MNIYALKVGNENTETVYKSLIEKNTARYGWSYVENGDLNLINSKINENQWDSLSDSQKDCWKAKFLLNINEGDYIVYINVPSYGKCTLAKVVKSYFWNWNEFKSDFSHCLMVEKESIKTFDRNDKEVHPSLSRRFKLQGKYWKIYLKEEFKELIEKINKNELQGDLSNSQIKYDQTLNAIVPDLKSICKKIYDYHPEKKLEELIQIILEKMPNVFNVERKSGASDKGADLICEFDTGLDFLGIQTIERCAIQVKSYENELNYDRAIEGIKNVFDYYKSSEDKEDLTCGLIISTADSMSIDFEDKLNELKKTTGKNVGVLLGEDLAKWFLKYGI